MHPAFSVIFLTTLIGVGQGLFLAMFTGQSYSTAQFLPSQYGSLFYGIGSLFAMLFLIAGLGASFFHLGRPERAWRAASQWRTSWLSQEVIVLPVVMFLVFVYGVMHYMGWDMEIARTETGVSFTLTLVVGALGVIATFALFLCTGMIYAAVKFLQEWASPLTVINYTLLGTASGFTLMTAISTKTGPVLTDFYGGWAIIITIAGFFTRSASLFRNAHIKYKSTVQSAIGVRHNAVVQIAQGAMGGSYNTREYSHGKTAGFLKSIKWVFMVLVFPIPVLLLWYGMEQGSAQLLVLAFLVQYAGLLAERWLFFAQANHPQNLYYQTV